MPPAIASMDQIRALIDGMPGPDAAAAAGAAAREPQLTKPPGALGRLEELALWLSAWQGRHPPTAERLRAIVFAGNHGVAARGVSAFPASVTAQMVANFTAGGAAVNQLCRTFGIDLAVHPLELERPVIDITAEPAMDEAGFVAAVAAGWEAAGSGPADLLCLGEMGIGNTTAAAALCHGLFGGSAADWCGPGTGLDAQAVAHKAGVAAAAVARHAEAADPLDLARRLGGRELAAIAGAVLAARHLRVPVVLDGFVCTAAAAPLAAVRADALGHCIVGHASTEPGHRRLLARLGKRPLLDLDMRLGEASGAVLAAAVVKAAAACHAGMATFAEAGVTRG
ncbi:MAG: nicotinate-nucleotide--dimethylbenzimidazole phosphoribosyltransferase [Rhodospirillales bacterium]|jgi:nicotinate-nucleotide--dimethylbenzimidazole phosphoribosyltransferase|nr:nicotinate-nucleotide--dimethylbenzimidazole phosphoribosyltransferase [Rhodospirillales bacterium]